MTRQKTTQNNGGNNWRIVIGNINSFPGEENDNNKFKLDRLRQLLHKHDYDIIMLSEHNKNIFSMNYHRKPSTLVKRWWQNTTVRWSQLISPSKATFEPGGTMIITHTRSTAHTCQSGEDRYNLGRWNYITLRGKQEQYTTIISVYRPNKHQETFLRQTAYTATRRQGEQTKLSPEDFWFTDLADLIREKQNMGHEILVGGDFNDNLNDPASKTRKFMDELGLRELMIDTYGNGPPTHIRGSNTIDGIFGTNKMHIQAGQYLSFEKSPSDHRWIEIEISTEHLLGTPRNDLCPPLLRKVTSKIPSVKTKFQWFLEQQVEEHQLYNKIHYLYDIVISQGQFTREQQDLYELIEQRMQRAVKYADNNCRKARRGRIPYSPTQKRLMGSIIILKQMKLRHLLRGKPNRPRSRRIKRLIKKYKYTGPRTFDNIQDLEKALAMALQAYGKFKPLAQDTRWTYLENIAKEYDAIDGKGIQHHYKLLHHREVTKEYFRRIRRCEGKSTKSGVDRIQSSINGQPTIVYDKQQIEQEIMMVNASKLLQASNTPLRSVELSDLLGEQGDFKKWEQALRGSIVLPEYVDEDLKIWFQYITNMPKHLPSEFIWTTEEYYESWTKMTEDKTTLPGIQVAHLKSIEPLSRSADVLSKLALIPLIVGYSPITWRTGIDSMIPKKVADLRPEKLRLILLMDARFNHNNKLIGKKMMEYGEQHNLLAPEQFGSRKHKSAIEQAANKRFTMDIIRQSGNRAMYIANDAKSCYDRILLMVAYLTMRNFGIPQSAAVCTISTILNMKHHIRTKYGDSQDYYGGDKWVEKPHGCGQGNGYGPALWACISSPLLHILREYGHGTHIVLPLSRLVLHISAFSFVDDTDIIQTKPTYNNSMMDVERKVFQESQKALDQWASVLACTGGALEPDKSFCIYINPQWKGPTRMLEPSKTARTIHMTDTDGHRIPLKQKKAHEAFFSLGIWHSPSGDERSQYQHLTQIIQKWGKATTTNKMTWFETRLAIKHTLGRTLTYSLPAIALSSNQCNKLQRLLHREVLGKMGIVRTAPSTIVTAPIYFGGLGVLDFEVAQLISHVQLLLQHGNETDTLTGQLLRATFEYHALEMGLPGDPLTMQVNEYGTLNTWISHTIRQLHKYDMRVASDISGLCSWTHGDRFIMEILSAQSTDGDLAIINKVRMYLRVVTISDLLTADGKHFDSQLLQGIRGLYNPQPSYARYNWPEVPQPTSREQNTWKRAMRQILSLEMYDPGHMALHTLLWRHQAVEYCRWGYSLATNKIYEYNDTKQWNIWEPFCDGAWRRTRQTSNLYMKRGTTRTLPDDVAVVSINRHHEYVRPVHIGCMEQPTEIHRQRNPKNEKMHTTALHRGFVYNIVMGNGQIFSDGSHMEGKSSFAFVVLLQRMSSQFADSDFTQIIRQSGLVHGRSEEQHSYRAELAGNLAAITFTNTLCTQFHVTSGRCTLNCDNKGALAASFGSKRPTPRWTAYDLVIAIRQELKKSKIQWRPQHVKGHQDNHLPFEHLSYKAQGNILADHFATEAIKTSSHPHTNVTNKQWTLRTTTGIISGNIDQRIKEHIYKPRMMQRWARLLNVPLEHISQPSWDIFFRSITLLPASTQTLFTKYNAKLSPVGVNMKRRRHAHHDECPGCGKQEDHDHIIRCTHPSIMNAEFEDQIRSLVQFLGQHTAVEISHAIQTLAFAFRDGRRVDEQTETRYVWAQYKLGQRAFFAGVFAPEWIQRQETYFSLIKSRRSAQAWLSGVATKLQQIPLNLWRMRNTILHGSTDNKISELQHEDMNKQIDDIFTRKPHPRTMTHCDNMYFSKHSKDKLKQMGLQRKCNWVKGATLIIDKYNQANTTQAQRFTSFFQWDRG